MIEADPEADELEESVTTVGVTEGLDMETDRLLYDDGKMGPLGPPEEKTQGTRRVEGRAALGLGARSHMRQVGWVRSL